MESGYFVGVIRDLVREVCDNAPRLSSISTGDVELLMQKIDGAKQIGADVVLDSGDENPIVMLVYNCAKAGGRLPAPDLEYMSEILRAWQFCEKNQKLTRSRDIGDGFLYS